MAYTKDQLTALQKEASNYGGFTDQKFIDYVNQKGGAGSYDKIKSNIEGMQGQPAVSTAPKVQDPIDTQTGAPVSVNVQPTIQQTPQPQPTQLNAPQTIVEAPKVQTPAKVTPIAKTEQFDINKPSYQDTINKEVQSGNTENLKAKLNEGLQAGTLDKVQYNRLMNSIAQSEVKQAKSLDNADTIFNFLNTGVTISDDLKQSPNYVTAKQKYDLYNKYNVMSSSSLLDELKNASIPTEMQSLLGANPNFAEAKANFDKYTKIQNINDTGKSNYEILTKTSTPRSNTILQEISDLVSYGKDETYLMSLKDYIAEKDPELVSLSTNLNSKNAQLQELSDARDDRLKDIIERYPGLTRNEALALAAKQNEPINNQIRSLSYEVNQMSADLRYRQSIMEADYNNMIKREEEQRQTKLALLTNELNYQRGLEQTASDRAYQEQQAQRQLEQKFAYEYGDINSTDPNIQRVAFERIAQAVQEQYKGMPFRRDVSTMAMDFMNDYNSGKSIEDITKQVTADIQGSPYFEKWKANNTALSGKETTTPKVEKVGTDANGKDIYATYNTTTGKYDPININAEAITSNGNVDFTKLDFSKNTSLINQYPKEASFKNNNPTGITWGISANTKKLLEDAGISYSLGTARPANEGGNYIKFDSVQDGLDAYMVLLTQAGTSDVYNRLKQWVGTSEGDSYATKLMSQAGITKGAKFSDLNEEQLSGLMSAQLQKESPNFFKELKNMPAETTYTAEVKSWGDNIINGIGGAKITSIQDKALRTQVSNYIAQKSKAEPNKEIFTIKNALTLLNELETHPGLEGAIGVGTKGKIPATPSASFMAKLSQLEAQQFLEGIQQMKGMGALSNAEGQKVSAAASSLINTAQSEQEWKAELQKIKDILQGKINTIEQTTGLKFDDMGSPTTGDMEFNNTGTDLRSKYFDNP